MQVLCFQSNSNLFTDFNLQFFKLDDDWEEEHEKLTEYLEEIPKHESTTNNVVGYSLEDFEESAYPGPQPVHLRNAHVDKSGHVEFEPDNEDAANVAASVSQILLDDDDIDTIISRPINYSRSMEPKVENFKVLLFNWKFYFLSNANFLLGLVIWTHVSTIFHI